MTECRAAGHRSVSVVLLFSSPQAGKISQSTTETLLLQTGETPGGWTDEWMCKQTKPEEEGRKNLGRYGPTYILCMYCYLNAAKSQGTKSIFN